MEILKDIKNDLLKRRELNILINEKTNPGFANVRKTIVEKLKVVEDSVAVKNIKSNFGTNEFLIEAFVYDSEKDLLNIEPKIKIKKKDGEK